MSEYIDYTGKLGRIQSGSAIKEAKNKQEIAEALNDYIQLSEKAGTVVGYHERHYRLARDVAIKFHIKLPGYESDPILGMRILYESCIKKPRKKRIKAIKKNGKSPVLTKRECEACDIRDFHPDWTVKQIAIKMGITNKAVYAHLKRAEPKVKAMEKAQSIDLSKASKLPLDKRGQEAISEDDYGYLRSTDNQ